MSTVLVNEAARRDFFICVGIWFSLEMLVFGVLPLVGLAPLPGDRLLWLPTSLVLGIVGAFLLSLGMWLGLKSRASRDRLPRYVGLLLSQLTSWLGLVGIAFPLLVMSIGIFTSTFSILTR